MPDVKILCVKLSITEFYFKLWKLRCSWNDIYLAITKLFLICILDENYEDLLVLFKTSAYSRMVPILFLKHNVF